MEENVPSLVCEQELRARIADRDSLIEQLREELRYCNGDCAIIAARGAWRFACWSFVVVLIIWPAIFFWLDIFGVYKMGWLP